MINVVLLSGKSNSSKKIKKILLDNSFNVVYCNKEKKVAFSDLQHLEIDYIFSFCYPYKIKKEVLDLANKAAINFHPAPLPEYRGFAVYNFGILNDEKKWGVTAHLMDSKFDTGEIIKVNKFEIENETAYSLRNKSHKHLVSLFKEICNMIKNNDNIKTIQQNSSRANYYSKKLMLENSKISIGFDNIETINKKIKAFWMPPYHGAHIEIEGEKYTLVNKDVLNRIKEEL